jgi:hypothetical protein
MWVIETLLFGVLGPVTSFSFFRERERERERERGLCCEKRNMLLIGSTYFLFFKAKESL